MPSGIQTDLNAKWGLFKTSQNGKTCQCPRKHSQNIELANFDPWEQRKIKKSKVAGTGIRSIHPTVNVKLTKLRTCQNVSEMHFIIHQGRCCLRLLLPEYPACREFWEKEVQCLKCDVGYREYVAFLGYILWYMYIKKQ